MNDLKDQRWPQVPLKNLQQKKRKEKPVQVQWRDTYCITATCHHQLCRTSGAKATATIQFLFLRSAPTGDPRPDRPIHDSSDGS